MSTTQVLEVEKKHVLQSSGGNLFVFATPMAHLPVELLRNIISDLLAGAIDALSMVKSPDEGSELIWERELVMRLAHISYFVREVTKEVVTKCFVIDPTDESWVMKGMKALSDLCMLNLKINSPSNRSSADIPRIPLFKAYGCLWDAAQLRDNLCPYAGSLVVDAFPLVETSLANARQFAEKVQPRRIALHVLSEIETEKKRLIVRGSLARADDKLRECLRSKKETEESHIMQEAMNLKFSFIKDDVNIHLTVLEKLLPDITLCDLMGSDIQSTVQDFTHSPFDLDDHDVHRRAIHILQAFNTIRSMGPVIGQLV